MDPSQETNFEHNYWIENWFQWPSEGSSRSDRAVFHSMLSFGVATSYVSREKDG